MATTHSERVLTGRIGAYTVHSRYDSREFLCDRANSGSARWTVAQLSHPFMVAVHDGVVYTVDNGNDRIRMVVP